ncbi:mechanosensitive ion channel family protein [Halococcus saccharolyticus]|uniref:Putative mechanosensitive ion channel n=1 Tax=Halococcus saccharolyticus DSM 5350 TaxID=1227455 RepID=M0MQQ3_9EURY|nr:mechanosensitive ion channel family protein [Halococcus saccharolyticus]EMA46810.1 putative mechanosensitive ion channel [Halococcus saccharolyticus DSM 5350]
MRAGVSGWLLQLGQSTGNGTDGNATGNVTVEGIGPVGRMLREFGIPYPKLLGAAISFVVALVVTYALGRAIVVPLFGRALDRRGLDTHEKKPIQRLLKILLFFVALAIAFRAARLSGFFTSLAAIAAAATLAIGLALQDTLSNFVAGAFIYADRPFRIGDWIEWPGGNGTYAGVVEDITFRVTRVRTFDNELLTVPNAVLTGGVIKNPVANDELRITFTFGIGYEDDIEQATDIILDEAEKHPDILDDPAPTVRMSDAALADSYVGLVSRFWIANPNRADFLQIRGEYVKSVKQRFDEAGIDIPYPQVDISGGVAVESGSRIEQFE